MEYNIMKRHAKIKERGDLPWRRWRSKGDRLFVNNLIYSIQNYVGHPAEMIEGYNEKTRGQYDTLLNLLVQRIIQFKEDLKSIGGRTSPKADELYKQTADDLYRHLEGLDKIDPSWAATTASFSMNRRIEAAIDRKQLALDLLDWHGGQGSGLYAVGSSWLAGHDVPIEEIQRADQELQGVINKDVNFPETITDDDIAQLQDLRKRLNSAAMDQSEWSTASNECGGFRPPKGKMDTRRFPECKGTPTDEDVVKKNRERKEKENKRKAQGMKIIKTASGKKLTISKSEWVRIGAKMGWLGKEAKWGKETKPEQPGKWTNYSKEELIKKRDAAKKRQDNRKEKGNKADPKDTELLRELNFAIRAKGDWGKAD